MNSATNQLESIETNTSQLPKDIEESAADASIIGLGPMGLALARTLLHNKYKITLWNRSNTKAAPLIQGGAAFAPNIIDAINASSIVIMCVADYKAANSILRTREIGSALAGRVLVQLSTGSPQEARDAEVWAKEYGIDYLDGAILVTPSQIGGSDSALLVSGSRTAFQKSEKILKTLATNLSYLGENVGAASALDLAFLSHFFGGFLGFYHGTRILEVEGLPVTMLGSMIAEVAPALSEIIKHDANVIQSDDYSQPESSLKNSATIVELILRQAQEARINTAFPTFAATLFQKGIAAGYEAEDVAALVKVLRRENG